MVPGTTQKLVRLHVHPPARRRQPPRVHAGSVRARAAAMFPLQLPLVTGGSHGPSTTLIGHRWIIWSLYNSYWPQVGHMFPLQLPLDTGWSHDILAPSLPHCRVSRSDAEGSATSCWVFRPRCSQIAERPCQLLCRHRCCRRCRGHGLRRRKIPKILEHGCLDADPLFFAARQRYKQEAVHRSTL